MKTYHYSLIILSLIACNKASEESENTNKENVIINEKTISEKHINLETEEVKLLKIYSNTTASSKDTNDSLTAVYSKQFSDSLVQIIKNNNSTFHFPFEKLQKENALDVITSLDKKLRVYSWDTHSGGTMRFYNQIFQYDTNGNTKVDIHLASEDSQAFFSKIYSVQTANNETIYLVISNSILSNKYAMQHIHAYKISKDTLQSVPAFKTKTNTLDKISVEYDFFSVVDRPERPVELITLEHNTLKIALVDENEQVTNKHLIYEWNGTHFIYKYVK